MGTRKSGISTPTRQWQAQEPPQPPEVAAGVDSVFGAVLSAGLLPSATFDPESEEVDAGAIADVDAGPPLKSVAYQPEPFN